MYLIFLNTGNFFYTESRRRVLKYHDESEVKTTNRKNGGVSLGATENNCLSEAGIKKGQSKDAMENV